MFMPHFFINSNDVKSGKVIINDKENFNHIVKSLRTKVGEKLLLIDENQVQYETTVAEVGNKELIVDVEESYKSNRKLDFNLYLAQIILTDTNLTNFIYIPICIFLN